MGLISKECPVGLDAVIQVLQRDLFIDLTKRFGWRDYDSFPRIYLNKRGNDTIPETYLNSGEYKEVLFNDKKTANSFFLADDKRTYDPVKFIWRQDVALIVQANLDKLKPKVKGRADEEVINDIRLAIKKKIWEERLDSVITGVDKVYSSLKLSYDRKYFDNMSNFLIVRVNFNLIYTNTEKTLPLR